MVFVQSKKEKGCSMHIFYITINEYIAYEQKKTIRKKNLDQTRKKKKSKMLY